MNLKSSYKKIFSIAAIATMVLIFLPIVNFAHAEPQGPSTAPLANQPGAVNLTGQSTAGGISVNGQKPAPQKPSDSFSCGDNLVTCGVYFVSWLINQLLKGAIIVSAALVAGILALDGQVYASPVVLTGFSVVLALANLGFVLAIIVIAIATILRNQTYGIKQMLWKLVLMAILVNFGLVITRPILQMSDSLSNYFLLPFNGSAGFVTNVTNAFAPQKLPGGGAANASSDTNNNATAGAAGGAAAGALICGTATVITTPIGGLLCMAGYTAGGWLLGGPIGSIINLFSGNLNDVLIASILSLIFSAIFLSIVAFSLLALFVMMAIRYVYITFLLVLLPLAWLAWVFPGLNSHFSKWWNLFLRWTFFPAIALFFMYLTLLMVPVNGTGSNVSTIANTLGQQAAGTSGAAAADTNLGELMIQEVVLCGLMLGGLYAANSLGITGASAAMGYVQNAGTWAGKKAKKKAGGYTKKQAQKGARAAYRSIGGDKITRGLQKSNIRPLAMAGRGLANITDNRAMVEAAAKNVPNDKQMFLRNMAGSMNDEMRMAYFQKGTKENWIKPDMTVGGKDISEYLTKNKDVFHSHGQDGEGSTEEKARDQSRLSLHEAAIDKDSAEKRNAELDAKRSVTNQQVQARAGVSDSDMEEYARLEEEDENGELGLSPEQITKRDGIKTKLEKAKSELGLSDSDQKEYNANKEKITKAEGTVKRIATSNPELASGIFMDDERARQKYGEDHKGALPPVTLEKESLDRMRKMMLDTFAKGFSPQNARGILEAVAKTNNMEYFEKAVREIRKNNPNQFKDSLGKNGANADLKRWMQNNSGKALFGNLRTLFGVPKIVKKRNGQPIEETEDEEEDNGTT